MKTNVNILIKVIINSQFPNILIANINLLSELNMILYY